jgi:stress-induced morphogen
LNGSKINQRLKIKMQNDKLKFKDDEAVKSRHSRAGGNPVFSKVFLIPAFAGMTTISVVTFNMVPKELGT